MALFGRRARPDDASGVADRVRALAEATDACRGRVPAEVVAEAERVATQVDRRLAFSGSATVVALAGATGSGKSSLFNALSGTDLARVGVTRPTTSEPLAVTWGDEPTEDLLDWLQVSRRHALAAGAGSTGAGSTGAGSIGSGPTRSGAAPGGASLDGLVLLDLPDHDSTEKSNQLQVDRMVQLVDVMVWVVDPQKYADAVLHERYLRPLVEHAPVMTVVLNQVDRLPRAEREACLRDLRRLLDSEGLQRTTIRAVSAETGEGLPELRELIAGRVADKLAAAQRLAADVSTAADRLATASGDADVPELSRRSLETMNTAMAEAAGARVVGDAVREAWRIRGAAATGWPVVAWIGRLKPDPLRRLHLDRLSAGGKPKEIDPTSVGRTSLPARSGVQQARVDTAVRDLAAEASAGLTRGWTDAVKAAARSQEARLPDALDRAVARTDLDVDRRRRWWRVVRVLQWILLAAVAAGLLWLAGAFVLAYLQLPPLPPVTWGRLPAPTVLVVGGVLAGLLLAGLSRIGVVVGATRRERVARAALRRSVTGVTEELVVQPVRDELDRYARARTALARATAR